MKSVTVTVKLNVPAVDEVPEIRPVPLANERPSGNAPEETVHDENEGVPPVAVRVCE